MAMRMSGMISGMDTESLISQLVDARKTKVDKTKKAQIKQNWKQEAWKDLNTKIKNLQSKYISNMRFASSYSKKTTKVSDSSKASVITGDGAVNSVQELEIEELAKTGYLTGAELKQGTGANAPRGNYTAMSTLHDLGADFAGDGTFSVKAGNTRVDINVTRDTTISDVLTKIKDAGLNASFDTNTQRFFISAKESGADSDFSITASDANGATALSKLGLQVNLNQDTASLSQYRQYSGYYVAPSGTVDAASAKAQTIANMSSLINDAVDSRKSGYLEQYKTAKSGIAAANDRISELETKYSANGGVASLDTAENYASQIESRQTRINELNAQRESGALTDDETAELDRLNTEVTELTEKKTDAETLAAQNDRIATLNNQVTNLENYISVTTSVVDGETTYTATATNALEAEEQENFYNKAKYAAEVMAGYDEDDVTSTGATKVSGQNARIKLNGATFTNNTNVFDINGLTITALAKTDTNNPITLTTENDTDGLYDMVKNFLKEYNSLINEMDKLYNAESAKGYEPLLTEEKDAMSDTEVEEYEKKIKSALLRNDSNLSSISSAMKEAMSGGFTVNGRKMYLTDFGINTLGYFTAADNEKNAYHIDGDPDDGNTSGNADKLKSLISSEPDTVVSFFTQLAQELYSKMSEQSKSVDGYRSFGNFYDDKKMESDYKNYTSKISEQEQKLNDYEDKWYKKFAKMESAMAKMQSKTNALAGLVGGS